MSCGFPARPTLEAGATASLRRPIRAGQRCWASCNPSRLGGRAIHLVGKLAGGHPGSPAGQGSRSSSPTLAAWPKSDGRPGRSAFRRDNATDLARVLLHAQPSVQAGLAATVQDVISGADFLAGLAEAYGAKTTHRLLPAGWGQPRLGRPRLDHGVACSGAPPDRARGRGRAPRPSSSRPTAAHRQAERQP